MAEKNLETYMNEQESEYQKKNEKLQKKKRSFKKKLIIFGVIFGVLVVFLFGIDFMTKDNLYKELKDIQITDVEKMEQLSSSLTAVSYPDLYDKFEAGTLGNKSINALNYGFVAENQYGYTTINDKGEILFHKDGTEMVISSEAISQININKDLIVYKGLDKKLYSCKHDGTDKKALVKDKVGTVVLAGENIYYVNLTKANNLYKYSLKEKKSELVLELEIKTFTIIADNILYLDYTNNLMLQDLNSTTYTWANANVVKFYFNGEVYVQNNNKIIKFNLNNHFPEEIASDINELLGVDESFVYYTVKNKVYSQNLNNGEKKELPFKFDYYKGVYSINEQTIALGGVK